MTQHVLGVKDKQLAEPVGNRSTAGLLYNLGQIFGCHAHLVGIIAYLMLLGVVIYGQLYELFQHLALA